MPAYDQMTDEELVKIVLGGDKDTFSVLVVRYQDAILRYCKRLLNFHPQDAEDVTAEVFFKAYKNLASFKPSLKFSSWLYRIAHNSSVNLIRDKSKLFFVDISEFWNVPGESKDVILTTEELDKILDQLNPTDKSLLVLFHLEEKSLKEIGSIFKLTQNTVAVKLKRARQRAKNILNKKSKSK